MNTKQYKRVRFYMPPHDVGGEYMSFHRLGGQEFSIRADSISCFEQFCLPFCLRTFVEVFQMRGLSHVVLESREEIEAMLLKRQEGFEP